MLQAQTDYEVKMKTLDSKLIKVGCYYVVSVKKGRRRIASLPQTTIEDAVKDFEVKFAMATL